MKMQIEGIPMTPEFFSQTLNIFFRYMDVDLKTRPSQIKNIKLKEIKNEEIIIELEYNPYPFETWNLELKTPKLKNIEPIEGACKHFIQRTFKLKFIDL